MSEITVTVIIKPKESLKKNINELVQRMAETMQEMDGDYGYGLTTDAGAIEWHWR